MQYSGVQSLSATGILNGLLRRQESVRVIFRCEVNELLADANRRLRETRGVFSAIRRGFLGAENDADAGRSFAAVEWHDSDRLLATPGDIEREK